MIDLTYGPKRAREAFPSAIFAPDLTIWLNLSQLAANISGTRPVVEGLVKSGGIKIDGVTDSGQPLFKASEIGAARDTYLRHTGRM